MNSGVSIRWTPSPALSPERRGRNRAPLNKKLNRIMLAMAADAHNRGGNPPWELSRRVIWYGGVTGTLTGRLRRGWRPVAGKARIINPVPYARDFYYGHPRRLVKVPAHVRRTKHGPVKVNAHYKYEPAQVGRPITWTRPWIEVAADAVLDHYELR